MRIGTNVSAILTNNSLQNAQEKLAASIQRLSSGYKINGSKDDPAGCAISDKMRVQLRGLDQGHNNTADGVSVVQTAEGALVEIQDMLTRLKELTVQAANDTNSDEERESIQKEIDQINNEIQRISDQTDYNTQSLINGNLQRRVYSNYPGVKQISVSDGFVADNYGITITQDARQAVAMGDGTISMSETDTIKDTQAGTISVNGYSIDISEGDDLNNVMNKIISGVNKTGGTAFTVPAGATNDTVTNGTQCAGYKPTTTFSGNQLVIMTNQYGSDQKLNITCSNEDLANLLGISAAATEDGLYAEGTDVKAEFTKDSSGKRVGFEDSAVISTKGLRITVNDINSKSFVTDVPGNIAGSVYDDTYGTRKSNEGKSNATSSTAAEIEQEVTDVGTMSIHVGANANQTIILDIPEVSTYTLGTQNINVMTQYTASLSINMVDEAIAWANAARSKLGAYSNRFEHTTANIESSNENLTTALSTMIDTDMAEEMTEYTSQTVLTQAATSILSQANQRPSEVMQLLQF